MGLHLVAGCLEPLFLKDSALLTPLQDRTVVILVHILWQLKIEEAKAHLIHRLSIYPAIKPTKS